MRRMVADMGTPYGYSDDELRGYIEGHALRDRYGIEPDEAGWTATYDLNAAAADVWDEKAAALAGQFDFSADGASFDRAQLYAQAAGQARYYRAKRAARAAAVLNRADPIGGVGEDAE